MTYRHFGLALAAVLVAVTALAVGKPRESFASGACYYNESPQIYKKSLGGGLYIETTLSIWSIDPASGCTQWAAHDWGDTIAEIVITSNTGRTFNNTASGTAIFLAAFSDDNSDGLADADAGTGNAWIQDSDQRSQQGEASYTEGELPAGTSETSDYWETPIVNMADGECLYGMDVELADAVVKLGGTDYALPLDTYFEQIVDTRSC